MELPPFSISRSWEVEPVSIVFETGEKLSYKHFVTRVDDWRMTAIGPVNFGFVHLGPPTPNNHEGE